MFRAICTADIYSDTKNISFSKGELCVGYIASPLSITIEKDEDPYRCIQVESGEFLDNFIPMPFDPLEDEVYATTGIGQYESDSKSEALQEAVNRLLILNHKNVKHNK